MDQKVAPTTEQLKDQWTAFASGFSQFLTRTTNVVAFQLVTQLQLYKEEVRDVIEVGCGAGGGTRLLVDNVRPDTNVVAFDLTPAFLDEARKRLSGRSVEFREASAEELPVADASFDRYMANYVLHLVTDPNRMLREARRVLRPGGVAAFSVWGRPENSPFYTTVSSLQQELGLAQPQTLRSNFHLGVDPENVKKMAIDAGFSRTYTWYSFIPTEASNTSEVVERFLASPQLRKLLAGIEEDRRKEFLAKLEQTVEKQFYSQGKPMGTEVFILMAYV